MSPKPTMTEEELWRDIFPDDKNTVDNYQVDKVPQNMSYRPLKETFYKCQCCEKSFQNKYITFPLTYFSPASVSYFTTGDVELCSKTCYDTYKSELPEKMWGIIHINNEPSLIPFHNQKKTFTFMNQEEISKLSLSQKEKYYEEEDTYCSLYPIKASIHFQSQTDKCKEDIIEEEYNDMSSIDSQDDY